MLKTLLRSKLHRINVTQVELDYEGSCAVDTDILKKGNFQEYEKIDIYDKNQVCGVSRRPTFRACLGGGDPPGKKLITFPRLREIV